VSYIDNTTVAGTLVFLL